MVMSKYEVRLKGHAVNVLIDENGKEHYAFPGGEVSRFRPEKRESMVLEALSEGDAQKRFQDHQGIRSTSAEWTIRLADGPGGVAPTKPEDPEVRALKERIAKLEALLEPKGEEQGAASVQANPLEAAPQVTTVEKKKGGAR